jgi:hypothetical protein
MALAKMTERARPTMHTTTTNKASRTNANIYPPTSSQPHRLWDETCHAYLGITALEGQVITPTLIGHRLTINPFLVFLSIAIWSWVWGPVGAFLAVPILLCAMVALRRL